MHHLTEENIFVFLLQVLVLLGLARALGELFRRWGQPTITAEIMVGIFLGPSILGRMTPGFQAWLFPVDMIQQNMLETVAWLGILFFLLNAGLETSFASAWRQRTQSAKLSFSDLSIPMIIAFVPTLFLASRYIEPGDSAVKFALFIAVIMTISAMPVTARVMQELKVYRTDLGLLIMSALTINDVAGWIVFALIIGAFIGEAVTVGMVAFKLIATLVFAAAFLTVGSHLFNRLLISMKRIGIPEPSGSLTLICLAGLIGGAITLAIGIHALFGFFIAGIMAGECRQLSERTRHIFYQMVQAILVPLFFASIGLKLDFLGQFDWFLCMFILVVGIFGRYIGAYIGARIIHQTPVHGKFIALAHIPGGEMQVVIGMVALEYGVISETVYVAVVFGAITSSVIAGPWMKRILVKLQQHDWLAYLPLDHILPDISSQTSKEAISELCRSADRHLENYEPDSLIAAVLEREQQMSTATGMGISVPHARLKNIQRPLVLFGRSKAGIEWGAADGKRVHFVFLVFTPEENTNSQLQILRGISIAMTQPGTSEQLLAAANESDIIAVMRQAVSTVKASA